MNAHAPTAPDPAREPDAPPCAGDDAKKAEIAHALWTEIHWLMPTDRTVSITVDGDDIAVGRPAPHGRPARRPLTGGFP